MLRTGFTRPFALLLEALTVLLGAALAYITFTQEVPPVSDRANARIAQLEKTLAAAKATIRKKTASDGGDLPAEAPSKKRREAPQDDEDSKGKAYAAKRYVDLLDELNLASDQEATVRGYLYDAMAQRKMVTERAIQSGELTARQVGEQRDAIAAQLRENLRVVPSGEALASWEAYEADREWNELVLAFDGKLAMISPGLTIENRLAASEVIVEERLFAQDAFYESEASQYARERLVGLLPEDQCAEAERLLTLVEVYAANTQQSEKP